MQFQEVLHIYVTVSVVGFIVVFVLCIILYHMCIRKGRLYKVSTKSQVIPFHSAPLRDSRAASYVCTQPALQQGTGGQSWNQQQSEIVLGVQHHLRKDQYRRGSGISWSSSSSSGNSDIIRFDKNDRRFTNATGTSLLVDGTDSGFENGSVLDNATTPEVMGATVVFDGATVDHPVGVGGVSCQTTIDKRVGRSRDSVTGINAGFVDGEAMVAETTIDARNNDGFGVDHHHHRATVDENATGFANSHLVMSAIDTSFKSEGGGTVIDGSFGERVVIIGGTEIDAGPDISHQMAAKDTTGFNDEKEKGVVNQGFFDEDRIEGRTLTIDVNTDFDSDIDGNTGIVEGGTTLVDKVFEIDDFPNDHRVVAEINIDGYENFGFDSSFDDDKIEGETFTDDDIDEALDKGYKIEGGTNHQSQTIGRFTINNSKNDLDNDHQTSFETKTEIDDGNKNNFSDDSNSVFDNGYEMMGDSPIVDAPDVSRVIGEKINNDAEEAFHHFDHHPTTNENFDTKEKIACGKTIVIDDLDSDADREVGSFDYVAGELTIDEEPIVKRKTFECTRVTRGNTAFHDIDVEDETDFENIDFGRGSAIESGPDTAFRNDLENTFDRNWNENVDVFVKRNNNTRGIDNFHDHRNMTDGTTIIDDFDVIEGYTVIDINNSTGPFGGVTGVTPTTGDFGNDVIIDGRSIDEGIRDGRSMDDVIVDGTSIDEGIRDVGMGDCNENYMVSGFTSDANFYNDGFRILETNVSMGGIAIDCQGNVQLESKTAIDPPYQQTVVAMRDDSTFYNDGFRISGDRGQKVMNDKDARGGGIVHEGLNDNQPNLVLDGKTSFDADLDVVVSGNTSAWRNTFEGKIAICPAAKTVSGNKGIFAEIDFDEGFGNWRQNDGNKEIGSEGGKTIFEDETHSYNGYDRLS